MTKLSARIPSGENDGFSPIATELVSDLGAVHLIIAEVEVTDVNIKAKDRTSEATVHVRAFEVVLKKDADRVRKILLTARKSRTGSFDLFDAAAEDDEDNVRPLRQVVDDDAAERAGEDGWHTGDDEVDLAEEDDDELDDEIDDDMWGDDEQGDEK